MYQSEYIGKTVNVNGKYGKVIGIVPPSEDIRKHLVGLGEIRDSESSNSIRTPIKGHIFSEAARVIVRLEDGTLIAPRRTVLSKFNNQLQSVI